MGGQQDQGQRRREPFIEARVEARHGRRSNTPSRFMVVVAVLIVVAGVVIAVSLVRAATSTPINTSQAANTRPAVVPVLQPTGAVSTPATTPGTGTTTAAGVQPQGNVSTSMSPSAAPTVTVYEADAATNILTGTARVGQCPTCPDGEKVRFLGNGGTLTFPNVTVATAGDYTLTVVYSNGDTSGGRTAVVSVNTTDTDVYFAANGDWNSTQTLTVRVHLAAGANRIKFSNPQAAAPDIAEIST